MVLQNSGRKKVGLALSGGGARGFAHLGVIEVLEAHSIPLDYISGTSAGSFVGGALASGMTAAEIIDLGRKISWFNMTGLSYSPRALLSNASMGNFIKQRFPAGMIEELKVPYAAVACDLGSGEQVLFTEGDLSFAIRASCAVPGVFAPLETSDGRMLIDGGVVNPVPVNVVRAMGADVVIAVDLIACGSTFRSSPRTMLGMLFQSAMLLLRAASKNQNYHADLLIAPEIAHLRPDEISKREELIDLGREAAEIRIDEIKEIIRS
ncbi:MAG: patatin-like phospholipase family protein [Acidobacteriota bacterium]